MICNLVIYGFLGIGAIVLIGAGICIIQMLVGSFSNNDLIPPPFPGYKRKK